MKKDIKILAIESSCDETAASVIGEENGTPIILSNIVSSQADLHAKTGGVVPEVASRAHMEAIVPVISEALILAKYQGSNINDQIIDKLKIEKLNENWKLITDNYSVAIEYLRQNVDYIAVTAGPGLIGSLLVGFNAAKSIAYALNKPIIPVNHIEGHVYSAFADSKKEIEFTVLSLTVSGGQTSITLMKDHGVYENIGQTLDDAAGEAFDKVAKLLGLGYPGGPIVSRMADEYRKKISNDEFLISNKIPNSKSKTLKTNNEKLTTVTFPRPILNDGTFNFSFSGLKTAVLQKVLDIKMEIFFERHPELVSGSQDEETPKRAQILKRVQDDIGGVVIPDEIKQEICAAFEDAVVDVLVTKTMRAVEKYQPKAVILAGGVAANKRLREKLAEEVKNYQLKTDEVVPSLPRDLNRKINLLVPPINLCGDNAVMIGLAAYYHIQKGDIKQWNEIDLDSNLELGSRN